MRIFFIFVVLFTVLMGGAKSQDTPLQYVDMRLILMVDGSSSMDEERWLWQLEGFAKALTDPEILNSIGRGPYGQIAIAVVRFDMGSHLMMPWKIIKDEASAKSVAAKFSQWAHPSKNATAIGEGLLMSLDLLRQEGLESIDNVIIVSGDGRNNMSNGEKPDILSKEIAINMKTRIIGAPMMRNNDQKDKEKSFRTLVEYYQDRVVAGAGGFTREVHSHNDVYEIMKEVFVYRGVLLKHYRE